MKRGRNKRQLIDVTVVRRVRPRAEHNVRMYRFVPADTRYIRLWNIPYVRIDFCRLIPGADTRYIRIWNITYVRTILATQQTPA